MIECKLRSAGRRPAPEGIERTAMNADLRRRADDLTARLTQLRDSL
jgi:hypothetical protein